MENPDLRLSMGMGPDRKGVRIRRIEPTAPESRVLRPSDVILSFDGVNISNDGTGKFSFQKILIMFYSWLSSSHDSWLLLLLTKSCINPNTLTN